MRRFWVVMCVAVLMCCLSNGGGYLGEWIDRADAVYSVYTSEERGDGLDVVDSGVGYILSGDKDAVGAVYKGAVDVLYGQSVSFGGDRSDVDALVRVLGVDVLIEEDFDGIYCLYGAGDFGAKVDMSGVRVNIQMAYRDGNITVGCPLILGAY